MITGSIGATPTAMAGVSILPVTVPMTQPCCLCL